MTLRDRLRRWLDVSAAPTAASARAQCDRMVALSDLMREYPSGPERDELVRTMGLEDAILRAMLCRREP